VVAREALHKRRLRRRNTRKHAPVPARRRDLFCGTTNVLPPPHHSRPTHCRAQGAPRRQPWPCTRVAPQGSRASASAAAAQPAPASSQVARAPARWHRPGRQRQLLGCVNASRSVVGKEYGTTLERHATLRTRLCVLGRSGRQAGVSPAAPPAGTQEARVSIQHHSF